MSAPRWDGVCFPCSATGATGLLCSRSGRSACANTISRFTGVPTGNISCIASSACGRGSTSFAETTPMSRSMCRMGGFSVMCPNSTVASGMSLRPAEVTAAMRRSGTGFTRCAGFFFRAGELSHGCGGACAANRSSKAGHNAARLAGCGQKAHQIKIFPAACHLKRFEESGTCRARGSKPLSN